MPKPYLTRLDRERYCRDKYVELDWNDQSEKEAALDAYSTTVRSGFIITRVTVPGSIVDEFAKLFDNLINRVIALDNYARYTARLFNADIAEESYNIMLRMMED